MYQCLHQMNVKTNKNELRETVMKEIVENKEFYYTKFKVDENNFLEFCNDLESKLTSILYLDILSSVLCSIFDCKLIQLNCRSSTVDSILKLLSRKLSTVLSG